MQQHKRTRTHQHRQLKVYPKYFARADSWRHIIFPEIRLCGKWLQNIGFEHGQTIKVLAKRNKITITVNA